MKSQIDRKAFLQATLATSLVGLVGCSGDGEGGGGDGDGDGDGDMMGDGDGDMMGSGGQTSGTGGDSSGVGGSTSSGGESAAGGSTTNSGGSDGSGGDDGSGGGDGETCMQDITVRSSGDGHFHDAEITVAQIEAGVQVNITTTNNAGHTHQFTLTADQLATIAGGGNVTIDVCAFVSHQFIIGCDSPPTPGNPSSC